MNPKNQSKYVYNKKHAKLLQKMHISKFFNENIIFSVKTFPNTTT